MRVPLRICVEPAAMSRVSSPVRFEDISPCAASYCETVLTYLFIGVAR